MSKKIFVGVDLGTTVLKTAAFDGGSGRALAQSAQRLGVKAASDGTREQSLGQIDRALRASLKDLRSAIGSRWRRVAGIGLATQGGSVCIVDRETGKPLIPMALWNDSRPLPYFPSIASANPRSYWRSLNRSDLPGLGLARLAWLKDTRPDLFHEGNLLAGAGEYLMFRLTGLWRQDAGNALQIGCFNVRKQSLDPAPLKIVDVPLSFVSPLRLGHETFALCPRAAKALDLPEGLPVAGPYMDHLGGYLSLAGARGRPLACSLGTAWVGSFCLPEDSKGHSPIQMVQPMPDRKNLFVVQPILTGSVAWDWALTSFVDSDVSRALKKAGGVFRKSLFPPDGLTALPWLRMPNPLNPMSMGAGAFMGINASTSREDMLRAMGLGLCYEFARVFGELKVSGEIDRIVLGGGASKGKHFQAILAGLFAPAKTLVVEDQDLAGPRGAVYAFSRAAARSKTHSVALPDKKTREQLNAGLSRYCDLFDMAYGKDHPIGGAYHFKD
jgi:sugar (pentulose or hexulose) kinase